MKGTGIEAERRDRALKIIAAAEMAIARFCVRIEAAVPISGGCSVGWAVNPATRKWAVGISIPIPTVSSNHRAHHFSDDFGDSNILRVEAIEEIADAMPALIKKLGKLAPMGRIGK